MVKIEFNACFPNDQLMYQVALDQGSSLVHDKLLLPVSTSMAESWQRAHMTQRDHCWRTCRMMQSCLVGLQEPS